MFRNVFWKEEPEQKSPEEKPTSEAEQDEYGLPDYNPFDHRDKAKRTSDFGALAHILKTSLGSGILAMPMAFRQAGLILGTVGTIFVGFLTTHCVQMLVWNSQILCRRIRVPMLSFAGTAETAFQLGPECARKLSKPVGVLITIELFSSFILGNSVYVVFLSHSIQQIVNYYWDPGVDVRVYSAAFWLPLTLMCMLPNLRSLVPFSIIANISVVVSFAITIYYILREVMPNDSVELVANPKTWPAFFTTVLFAVEGIGTVLPIENEMRHPENFIGGRCGILYIAMTTIIILYTFVGFFGYFEYGDRTQGSITLNLPITDILGQSVKMLIALAIFFTFALQFYVPIQILLNVGRKKITGKNFVFYSIGIRVLLVSTTIVISVVIPHLEPIIGLVGAICFSMLGLLFPSLIDTMGRYPHYGYWKWRLWKNLAIAILSLVALISGVYQGIDSLIYHYSEPEYVML